MKRPPALIAIALSIFLCQQPSGAVSLEAKSLHQQARALVRAGRLQEAIEKEQGAAILDPLAAVPHESMTFIHLQLGRLDLALREAEIANKLAPGDALAWFNLGRVLQSLGKHTQALKAYECAIRLKPDHLRAKLGAAECLLSLGRIDDSLALLEPACKSHATNGELWTAFAITSLAKGNLADAELAAQKAVQLNPGSIAAVRVLAQIELSLKNISQSILLGERLIDLAPQDRNGFAFLLSCLGQNRPSLITANLLLEKAHNNLPSDAHLFYSAGLTFFRLSYSCPVRDDLAVTGTGRDWLSLAERSLRYAVKAAPDQSQCHLALSTVLTAEGSASESLKEAEFAGKLNPGEPHICKQISALRRAPNDLAGTFKAWLCGIRT